jgi:DNA-directed RNA polymerase specialized sigma24 family protein
MELVKAIAADDQAAIETFVKKFRPRLVRFARRRGVRWPDCEDVAQEAVLAAVSQLQRETRGSDMRMCVTRRN